MKRMVWTQEVYDAYLDYYPLHFPGMRTINKWLLALIAKPFIRVEPPSERIGPDMNELTPQHVEDVYVDCLANESTNTVDVQGIVHTSRFSLVKLLERKLDITALLSQLPREFFPRDQGGEGGWSFLNACMDRDGQQWTGLHMTMEQLVVLGVATNQVHWCMPRYLWSAMPGGMPYLIVGLEL